MLGWQVVGRIPVVDVGTFGLGFICLGIPPCHIAHVYQIIPWCHVVDAARVILTSVREVRPW